VELEEAHCVLMGECGGLDVYVTDLLMDGHLQGGTCLLCIIYTYYRVPEITDRTFAEVDLLFERRVPARKFSGTAVDVFAAEEPEKGVEDIVHRKADGSPGWEQWTPEDS
jgi:hypothetical protein